MDTVNGLLAAQAAGTLDDTALRAGYTTIDDQTAVTSALATHVRADLGLLPPGAVSPTTTTT